MASLVCFDTHFAIWAFKRQTTPGQESCLAKAAYLVQKCEDQGDRIILPSIVVAEILSGTDEQDHQGILDALNRNVSVLPFDVSSAIVYARMWKDRRHDMQYSREESKADYLIAAIAVAQHCRALYTGDASMATFARGHITVVTPDEITVPAAQPSLYAPANSCSPESNSAETCR